MSPTPPPSPPPNLLVPFHAISRRIETIHQEMLERLKSSASRMARITRSACFVRWSPILLIVLTATFVLVGATSFYLFEKDGHEMKVRKWYMNLAVERRQFAKSISSRIFNDTRNLLIIIDREQTERVQQLLVESLKRYEDKLDVIPPSRRTWTWPSCFNFAYSLVLTVGAGFKEPSTTASRVFAVFYCLIGVPLFYLTLTTVVYRLIAPVLKWPSLTRAKRFLLFQLVLALYVLWTILIALCLYYQVINDFWLSVFTAFAGSLTIQMPSAAAITTCGVLFINLSTTISVALLLLMLLIAASVFFPQQLLLAAAAAEGGAIQEKVEPLAPPPKFQVIVDEAGESKLTTA
ncbi:unnamed protein product [Caenorhabditis bovis]|uniref:Potassium channel domain-containing protein n=1 Tax=Caenorhabditis bovis TaxID=2654633 RepID=A0A8S1EUI5_9PELO|nr:unnamed protein product [Caenorhabditis bovis]